MEHCKTAQILQVGTRPQFAIYIVIGRLFLIKMIQKKEINKEIVFFYYEQVTSKIIDEVIEFIQNVPKSKNSIFSDGTNILIDNIRFDINNKKPTSISIGVNLSGSVSDVKLKPKKYYYFKGGELTSVENPDDVVFWG